MGSVKYTDAEDDPILAWRKRLEAKNQASVDAQNQNAVSPLFQGPNTQNYADRRSQVTQTGAAAVAAGADVAQQKMARTQAIRARKFQEQQTYAQQEAARKAKLQSAQMQWKQYKQQLEASRKYQTYMNGLQNPGTTQVTVGGQPAQPGQPQTAGQAQNGQYKYSNSTYNQIAQWARQAGWSEDQIPMVVSIAMAESGGNPAARHANNDSHGSVDMGLMQINDYWQRDKTGGVNIDDPIANLKIAKQVYDEAGGWSPWSTFKNGAYQNFLSDATNNRSQVQGLVPVQSSPYAMSTADGSLRAAIVQNAQHVIGLPYVWGGASLTTGADCSGLVEALYQQLGIDIPEVSSGGGRAQSQVTGLTTAKSGIRGTRTNVNSLQPGDLVAWQGGWAGPSYVGHIAVYVGNGQIIESPDVGMTVRQRALRPNENTFGIHLAFS
jgi:cell wall-associated NlpC family hydrolase